MGEPFFTHNNLSNTSIENKFAFRTFQVEILASSFLPKIEIEHILYNTIIRKLVIVSGFDVPGLVV
jgi:hypothetical protein